MGGFMDRLAAAGNIAAYTGQAQGAAQQRDLASAQARQQLDQLKRGAIPGATFIGQDGQMHYLRQGMDPAYNQARTANLQDQMRARDALLPGKVDLQGAQLQNYGNQMQNRDANTGLRGQSVGIQAGNLDERRREFDAMAPYKQGLMGAQTGAAQARAAGGGGAGKLSPQQTLQARNLMQQRAQAQSRYNNASMMGDTAGMASAKTAYDQFTGQLDTLIKSVPGGQSQPGGQAAPTQAPAQGSPPKEAVDHLLLHPELTEQFEQQFGPGSASRALGGQ